MAKIELTKSQRNAVEAPISNLLVSAAAGSGKTAVLCKRIINRLCDPDANADITRMLAVTFTKAAASELKARIAKELSAAAEAQFENKRIAKQLLKLERAQISTIHSFCFELVKSNFNALGLSASLRIIDDAENQILKARVMEDAIDALYESDPSFGDFADNLVSLRDDRLGEILVGFYDRMASLPQGIGFARERAEELHTAAGKDFSESRHAAVIESYIGDFFAHYKRAYENALNGINADENIRKAYFNAFDGDYRFICGWLYGSFSTYAERKSYLESYNAVRRGSLKSEYATPFTAYIADMREKFGKTRKSILANLLSGTSEDIARDTLKTADLCGSLYNALSFFDERYTKEKKRFGLLDYNDLEKYSVRLLIGEDGAPTPLARDIAGRYDEIYIDEYQDINSVQDMIFKAISSSNRFMVGDVKQSIYGFRGAVPDIFSGYRSAYADYNGVKRDSRIFLSENFRSDSTVISFSNMIFESLFNNNSGRVPYYTEDALVCGKNSDDDGHIPVKIALVKEGDEGDGEERYVAAQIRKAVENGTPPEKIAVLLRSMKKAEAFRKALEREGVRSRSRVESGVFEAPEVSLLLCMLNVLDNPSRDIYFAGLLKSPIFGYTLDELATMRMAYPKLSFYEAFLSMPDDDRKKAFTDWFNATRSKVPGKSTDRIIRTLFGTTPIRAISIRSCGNCKMLDSIYDCALRFESGSFKGLHSFLRYVADSVEKNIKISGNEASHDFGAVSIMSVHQSKGLEFDTVFLGDTGRGFNLTDKNSNIVFEKELGIAMRLRDESGFVLYDTQIRRAVALKLDENSIDEEMRILYVALTRAKKRLIVTCGCKEPEKLLGECAELARVKSKWAYANGKSYIRWILMSLDVKNNCYRIVNASQDDEHIIQSEVKVFDGKPIDDCKHGCGAEDANEKCTDADGAASPNSSNEADNAQKEGRAESVRDIAQRLVAGLSFVYPHEASVRLPSKLSVSRLYPGILDNDGAELLKSKQNEFMTCPGFMSEDTETSGAERGTATHLFLQFCDFSNAVQNGVANELERLMQRGFINPHTAELVMKEKLEAFFRGKTFAEIMSAREVYREHRFNVRLSAEMFTQDEKFGKAVADESVLVQGVVDCLYVTSDGRLKLLDYKTDRIRRPPDEAMKELRERYITQLSYYRLAIEKTFARKVDEAALYSLDLDREVRI